MKGFELQFHWIFVLIAGMMILLFFVSVGQKYRSISEQKLSNSLAWTLDTAFTAVMQSPNTAQLHPSPPGGVSFLCDPACNFIIGRRSKPFGDRALFAAGFVKQDIVLWTVPWKSPYKVTNALFVSSPVIAYHIVYDDQEKFDKIRRFPAWDYLNIYSSDSTLDLVHDGSPYVRVVFLGKADDLPSSFYDVEVSGVEISEDSATYLHKPRGQSGWRTGRSVPLPGGIAPVMAAMVARDDVMLGAGLKQMYASLYHVSKVYRQRLMLMDAQDLPEACVYSGSFGVDYVDDLIDAADVLRYNVYAVPKIQEMHSAAYSLVQRNEELLQNSCPTVM